MLEIGKHKKNRKEKVMVGKYKCIIKNEQFEVGSFTIADYGFDVPENYVITNLYKETALQDYYTYELTNGVIATMRFVIKSRAIYNQSLFFEYKGSILKELKLKNMQSLADYFNLYQNMSSKNLETLLEETQQKTKTILEKEIEVLKLQKSALEEQLQTYIKIQQKREEINELIKKLDR